MDTCFSNRFIFRYNNSGDMNRGKAVGYFKSNFNLSKSTNGWYRFSDPFDNASDKSMGVNFHFDKVVGHRSGYRSNMSTFIETYEKLSPLQVIDLVDTYSESSYEKVETIKEVPDDYVADWPEYYKPLIDCNRFFRMYVEKKAKLDFHYLDQKGFGGCELGRYADRIIIPVYVQGVLKYWQSRAIYNSMQPKYLNAASDLVAVTKSQVIYNQDALDYYDKIYVCEGWSDAETIGEDAVAIFGWKNSVVQWNLFLRSAVKEFVVVADKGFYNTQVAQWIKVSTKKVKVLNMDNAPGKDVNEVGLEYVEDLEEKTDYLTFMNLFEWL